MADTGDARRKLPGVDKILERPEFDTFRGKVSNTRLSQIIRQEIEKARKSIEKSGEVQSVDSIAGRVFASVEDLLDASPKRVINCTGIILHTGLGRAPLSRGAIDSLLVSCGYCDLEVDMQTGLRGNRQEKLQSLLAWLTGSEGALVVNNNAAALYLVLHELASGKEVIVSRGQLIEIGGSFRLPEIMSRSGAKLVEVGTTNRTRADDFRSAIGRKSAMLLRAYPSNYRIEGFSESVSVAELAKIARSHNLICVDDLGGGLLWDWAKLGLPEEPNVTQSLEEGADLVLVSGDKVLGGPQAGIILGRKELITKLRRSPLARILRPGKLEIAALASTLKSFLHPSRPSIEIPTWRMLTEPVAITAARAEKLKQKLGSHPRWTELSVIESSAQAGSGTMPVTPLPSVAVSALPKSFSASRWAKQLRNTDIPVIGIIKDEVVLFNMRTVADEEVELLGEQILNSIK